MKPIELAKFMHRTYEEKAKEHGWGTQKSCRVKFIDLPLRNKLVMLSVAKEIIRKFNEGRRKYYKKNRDKISICRKKNYQKNKKKFSIRHKRFFQKNKKNILKQQKQYYKKNKEKSNAYSRKYYKENKKELLKKQKGRDRRKNEKEDNKV